MNWATPCSASHAGSASTTGPVCPPTARACSTQLPNGTTGPTASNVPVIRSAAQSSSQPARSRASITWVGTSGVAGTSIGPRG
jgi:hypothetical protein